MTTEKPQKWVLWKPVTTIATVIIPELAMEVGFNESIVLMQISFWLTISNNLREGKYWTYQTLRDMKEKAFPYWSHETIRRTILSLQKQGYILVGNFNDRTNDKTQWFALEPDKCSSLKSVLCSPFEREAVTNLDNLSQNVTTIAQNVTTLPEITTDRTQNKDIVAPKVATSAPAFPVISKTIVKHNPYTVTDKAVEETKAARKSKRNNPTSIPKDIIDPFKDEMVNLFKWSWATMTKDEKGQIQNASKQLIEVGLSISDLISLYRYCEKRFTNFSPMALVKHVSDWRKENAPKAPSPLRSELAKPKEIIPPMMQLRTVTS